MVPGNDCHIRVVDGNHYFNALRILRKRPNEYVLDSSAGKTKTVVYARNCYSQLPQQLIHCHV